MTITTVRSYTIILLCNCTVIDAKNKIILLLFTVKENQSDVKIDSDADCAEKDVGCWSQKWSAR